MIYFGWGDPPFMAKRCMLESQQVRFRWKIVWRFCSKRNFEIWAKNDQLMAFCVFERNKPHWLGLKSEARTLWSFIEFPKTRKKAVFLSQIIRYSNWFLSFRIYPLSMNLISTLISQDLFSKPGLSPASGGCRLLRPTQASDRAEVELAFLY